MAESKKSGHRERQAGVGWLSLLQSLEIVHDGGGPRFLLESRSPTNAFWDGVIKCLGVWPAENFDGLMRGIYLLDKAGQVRR